MQKLLFLHGAIGSKDQFLPLQELCREEFDVLTFNFSGHGGREMHQGKFSIEFFATEVLQFLEEKEIDHIDVFGYSMGGYVALYLAKNFPDKIRSVITLATKFKWDKSIAEKEIKMLNPAIIEDKIPAFAKVLSERHMPNDWKIVLNKTAEMMQLLGDKNCLEIEEYKSIQQKVLIMLGDRDKMISLEETMEVYKILPGGAMAMLPNTSHPLEQVDPELLLFYIKRSFLTTRMQND